MVLSLHLAHSSLRQMPYLKRSPLDFLVFAITISFLNLQLIYNLHFTFYIAGGIGGMGGEGGIGGMFGIGGIAGAKSALSSGT